MSGAKTVSSNKSTVARYLVASDFKLFWAIKKTFNSNISFARGLVSKTCKKLRIASDNRTLFHKALARKNSFYLKSLVVVFAKITPLAQ